jgi:hypothetical protein
MATPKLSITLRNSIASIDKLKRYKLESESLEAKYQHFISEMIMLRLFSIFEDGVAELAYKLASGASYTNGNFPTLSQQAGSMLGARGLFLNFGRSRPVQNLKWTRARFIKESVQHVISITDPIITNAQSHGNIIEEMRKVRNVLAHNSRSAKLDFRTIVRITYGANVKITPGAFLSTKRRTPISNLDKYLASTKIVLNDLARGF